MDDRRKARYRRGHPDDPSGGGVTTKALRRTPDTTTPTAPMATPPMARTGTAPTPTARTPRTAPTRTAPTARTQTAPTATHRWHGRGQLGHRRDRSHRLSPSGRHRARVDPLSRCTGDPRSFLSDTWGVRAAVHPAAGPRGFEDLLTLDDVDRILTTTSLRTPSFRLVKAGEQIPESAYTRSGRTGSKPVSGHGRPGSDRGAVRRRRDDRAPGTASQLGAGRARSVARSSSSSDTRVR